MCGPSSRTGGVPCQAAMGVMAMVSEVRVNVFVFTHACDAVSAAEALKVPAVDADHRLM